LTQHASASPSEARAPEALLPIRLNRRRIFILPTRQGLLFLFVLFAMLLGSINYNNNLGFLLVFLLGGMLLVSIIHTWRNLLGLTILSVSCEPVFAGQTAFFSVLLSSGPLIRKAVTYGFEKQERQLTDIASEAAAQTGVRLETPAAATWRGFLTPGRFVLATRFPLGLFRAWSKLDIGAGCIVYPQPMEGPLQWKETADDAPDAGQAGGANRQRGVDDFDGLKQYQPGDALGHISWKTLSRGQGLFTKDFRAEAGRGVMIDYAAVSARDAETRLSRLADLVLRAGRMDAVYGLNLPGLYLPPDRGAKHRHACLKALALFDANAGAHGEGSG